MPRTLLRAAIEPEQITAVIDTREQQPLDLAPLRIVRAPLPTGDYSVQGLEQVVTIERKSLPDLVGCVGQHRRRFEREVRRLLAFPVRALVIEASWADLERGRWRGRLQPRQVVGSCLGWLAAGLPVVMAGDRSQAARLVSRLLFIAARRRWLEVRPFFHELLQTATPPADEPHIIPGRNGRS